MKSNAKVKKQFIDLCLNYYKENPSELSIISEFEREYSSSKAIWWFTRNCFISKLINKAIREKNFDILFSSRFFFHDIHKQIEIHKCLKPVRVYRSQLITDQQLKTLKDSIGKIISINSFILTNLIRKQSLSYLKQTMICDDFHGILFEIDVDPKLNGEKPFANITSQCYFTGEQKILFMVGTTFRIVHIEQYDNQISIIQMALCNNNQKELNSIEDSQSFDFLSFGYLLMDMQKFDEADIYFSHLLHQLSDNHSDISNCYNALGNISLRKEQYDSSLKWFKKSLDVKTDKLEKGQLSLASIHNNIALVYLKKNDFEQALISYHMALIIFREECGENHLHVTECFNNIAMVYKNQKKYEEALNFYTKVLTIHEESYSIDHPDIAMSHTNIAIVYGHLNLYDLALEHYNKALTMYEKLLSLEHCLVSMIFENIGNIYSDKEDFLQALLYYEKAAELYRQLLPSTHPDVLQIEIVLKRIKLKFKKN